MTEAAGSSLTSIYVYIYQTVQNHTPDDIFLIIALRISNVTVLQHVRDYPLHIVFNILFLAAPRSWSDKTYTQFSSPDSATISFPIYTFRPSFQVSKNVEITHYEVGFVILKRLQRSENVWHALKRYSIRIWTLNLIAAPI